MFRPRIFILALAIASLPAVGAFGQSTVLDGGIDDPVLPPSSGIDADFGLDSLDPASPGRVGPEGSVVPVAPVEGAAAAAGSAVFSGESVAPLTGGGRIRPIQPFAERLRAVERQLPEGGFRGSIDDGVFGGDTLRDRARGLRAGSFLLYPELFAGLGWTDNAGGEAGGTPASFYRVAPTVRALSDWSRHQLGLSLRGSFTGVPSQPANNEPFFDAAADLRLDLTDQTRADLIARYGFSREDRGTAEASGTDQDIHEVGAGLRLGRDVGLLGVELFGDADYTAYTGVSVPGTSGDRNNTVYSAGLRLDGLTGAVVAPFAEGRGLGRVYTEACSGPPPCEDRDSTGFALRGGITVDAGSKLRGELGAGWRVENLEDDALGDLAGLLVDGSLLWSPTRLTTVTATIGTNFAGTNIVGASGSIIYSGDLVVAHSLSESLAAEAGVGYSLRRYEGILLDERQTTATAALIWAFANNVALQTRYTYRHFDTTTSGGDYDSSTIEAGLRFRH